MIIRDKVVSILGVSIDKVSFDEALGCVEGFVQSKGKHHIVTINPEYIVEAQYNRRFMEVLNRADLAVADGFGLILAGKLLGTPFLERIAGTDLVYQISQLAANKGWRVFLLGGKNNTAEKAASKLKELNKNLSVSFFAGTSKIDSESREEWEETIRKINDFKVDILFVAYGSPWQDLWIADNLDKLETVKVAMGVGGALDFIAGVKKRAPKFLQKLGLEWLWRLALEPLRLPRIFRAVVIFPLLMLKQLLFLKIRELSR